MLTVEEEVSSSDHSLIFTDELFIVLYDNLFSRKI